MKAKFNNVTRSINKAGKWISKHSNTILTVASIGASVGACVEIAKSAPIAKEILDDRHEYVAENDIQETPIKRIWEDTKAVAPIMAPGIAMEIISVGAAIGSYKISTKRIGAFATAYKLSETTLKEYQAKVIEKIGEEKNKEIKDEITKEHVNAKKPGSLVCPDGEYPCIDSFAQAQNIPLFTTSEYKIRKAEIAINNRLRNEMWISLNEFYSELGIGRTGFGDILGWNIDKVGEDGITITVGSCIADDGTLCLTMDYDCDLIEHYDAYNC